MLICCWSSKGGVGTTVVAAALALRLAAHEPPGCLLVDLAGDAATVLGLPPDLADEGVAPWRIGAESSPEVRVRPGLGLRSLSAGPWPGPRAADVLLDTLADERRPVVVDAGVIDARAPASVAFEVACAASHSLLVLRPCFVALHRAMRAPLRPSGVVLVEEVGRALTAHDVEEALAVPVCARVHVTAQIARAVDAGLLAVELPTSLERDLRHAA